MNGDNDGLIAGASVVGVGLAALAAYLVTRDDGGMSGTVNVPEGTRAAFDPRQGTPAPTVPDDPAPQNAPDDETTLAEDIALTGELPTGNDVASRIGLVNRQQDNDVQSGFTGL
jgi:hypothetical protein